MLIDCNNFYCSCERVFNPKLAKLPIAVLSSNDGCIIARSLEVKAMGIPMGAPYYKYKQLIKSHDGKVFSANFELYGDMSRRVMRAIYSFTPNVEIYSIDEAFVSFDGVGHNELQELALAIKQRIYQWTGIPVSIGIGPTKTLAKVANHIAKKQSGDYIFNISDKAKQQQVLANFAVEDIWGVGSKWALKLRGFGINSAMKLCQVDIKWMRQNFSVVGERLVRELKGISCLDLDDLQPKKSIASSRSFGKAVNNKEELAEALSYHVARCCAKLRQQNSKVKVLYAYIRTNRFREGNDFYHDSALHEFAVATSDTGLVIKAVKSCLNKIFRAGYDYTKAGVILTDLVQAEQIQQDFFAKPDSERNSSLMQIIDDVNRRYCNKGLFWGAQGVRQAWKPRCDFRSPRYTTNWDELMVADTAMPAKEAG
jgi:DNA polymerase V